MNAYYIDLTVTVAIDRFYFCFCFSVLLNKRDFVEHTVRHIVEEKLINTQLLQGLCVLCEYQGTPIEQNQSKL